MTSSVYQMEEFSGISAAIEKRLLGWCSEDPARRKLSHLLLTRLAVFQRRCHARRAMLERACLGADEVTEMIAQLYSEGERLVAFFREGEAGYG